MPVTDTSTTTGQGATLEQDIVELRHLLDRLDGLTHQARVKLRRLEQHQSGIDPHWTSKHR